MRSRSAKSCELWPIVLAGGDGRRVSPLVRQWMGFHRPKQYCTFVGTRSMFQHTVDRAALIAPPERTVIIIDRTHAIDATTQLRGRSFAKLILQPANRGTAAGILLPVSYVRSMNPEATVVICPSDHFVFPEEKFVEGLCRAARIAESMPEKLILLGAVPGGAETDYGWIRPVNSLGCGNGPVREVDSCVEKPGIEAARSAFVEGALWNTLVVAAKVRTIWELARQYLPDVFDLLKTFHGAIGSRLEDYALESVYAGMPNRDFSSALLQRAVARLAVVSLDGIYWSDWGRPERIVATLQAIGKVPAFPLECVRATASSGGLYASIA